MPGRMEVWPRGFTVLIDFAHPRRSGAPFESLFDLGPRRLLVLFGAGGTGIREAAPMAEAVARYADPGLSHLGQSPDRGPGVDPRRPEAAWAPWSMSASRTARAAFAGRHGAWRRRPAGAGGEGARDLPGRRYDRRPLDERIEVRPPWPQGCRDAFRWTDAAVREALGLPEVGAHEAASPGVDRLPDRGGRGPAWRCEGVQLRRSRVPGPGGRRRCDGRGDPPARAPPGTPGCTGSRTPSWRWGAGPVPPGRLPPGCGDHGIQWEDHHERVPAGRRWRRPSGSTPTEAISTTGSACP